MGLLNKVYPIFFYLKLRKSATGRAFDGVVTPSGGKGYTCESYRKQWRDCISSIDCCCFWFPIYISTTIGL